MRLKLRVGLLTLISLSLCVALRAWLLAEPASTLRLPATSPQAPAPRPVDLPPAREALDASSESEPEVPEDKGPAAGAPAPTRPRGADEVERLTSFGSLLRSSRDDLGSGQRSFAESRAFLLSLLKSPDAGSGSTTLSQHTINAMDHARALGASWSGQERGARAREVYAAVVEAYRSAFDPDEKALWLAELVGFSYRLGPCVEAGQTLLAIVEAELGSLLNAVSPRFWSKWCRMSYVALKNLTADLCLNFAEAALRSDPPVEILEGLCEITYRAELFDVEELGGAPREQRVSELREALLAHLSRSHELPRALAPVLLELCRVAPQPRQLPALLVWLDRLAAADPLAAQLRERLAGE